MKQALSESPESPERGFRAVLRDELARRCTDNARYSLRAFARDLGTDHSSLSQVLRGRRALTEAAIRRFGAALGLEPGELDALVAFEQRHPGRAPAPNQVKVLRDLTDDMLAVVSEPEHFALLELVALETFRPDVRWIGRVLGLEPERVNLALQRLLRLELLHMKSATEWIDCSGDLVVSARGLEGRLLRELALRLERGAADPGEREYSSTVLSIDRADLPRVRERLARCRDEILSLLEGGDARDAVYRLELAFLPLSKDDPETD